MITRIVRLSFQASFRAQFIEISREIQPTIESFAGCHSVDVLNDVDNSNVFFTYSKWDSVADLNAYRDSDFFKNVWAKTKKGFNEKPMAWSTESVIGEV